MRSKSTYQMILSGLFIAIGLILPLLTGQIPQIGSRISPMHIPVFLCGFLCGWPYALAVGFITPLLRSVIFQMPPLFPTATAMAFELAAYGLLTSVLFRVLRARFHEGAKQQAFVIYITLVAAMLVGRAVWGLVSVPIHLINGTQYTFALFLTNGFVNAVPAIVLHIALIPPIILALGKAKMISEV